MFEEAKRLIPGGVNSPVRAYGAVGGSPPFIARGDGPWVWDVDGNRYLDLVCSWGPLILGHRPATVIKALRHQLERGWTFGAPTEGELRLATAVSERMPAIEMLRLVNSGTEAAMSAVRLARGVTGRRKLIKFAGGYHGHADALLVEAGSGVATLGIPGTPGITPGAAEDTLVVPYNELADVEAVMKRWQGQVAAIIVEPVAGNMGVVPPSPGFLAGLRELTQNDGSLLIFDEVITGFRVARGGAQELYGVAADLSCLGKVLGGGLPIGAYGGRRELMEQVAPAGPVYQAGTLSGNPTTGRRRRSAGPGPAVGGRRRRRPADDQPRGVDADSLLHRRRGTRLRQREAGRRRVVRQLVPASSGERGPASALTI